MLLSLCITLLDIRSFYIILSLKYTKLLANMEM